MSEYVEAAMQSAGYDRLSSGGWFGALPWFHGVMAWGETEEACYHALLAELESAIEEAVRNQRRVPEFVGVATPQLEQAVNS